MTLFMHEHPWMALLLLLALLTIADNGWTNFCKTRARRLK